MNNLDIVFTQGHKHNTIYQIESNFNTVDPDHIIKFALDYIFDIDFNTINESTGDLHLVNEELSTCQVSFQSNIIGEIQLRNCAGTMLYEIVYNTPVEHTVSIDEFNPYDRYYHVIPVKSNNIKFEMEVSDTHPYSKQKIFCSCHAKTKYNNAIRVSCNTIINYCNELCFVVFRSKRTGNKVGAEVGADKCYSSGSVDDSDSLTDSDTDGLLSTSSTSTESEEIMYADLDSEIYCYEKSPFDGYNVKQMNFTEALKCLLLLHITVNKLDNNYMPIIPTSKNGTVGNCYKWYNLCAII